MAKDKKNAPATGSESTETSETIDTQNATTANESTGDEQAAAQGDGAASGDAKPKTGKGSRKGQPIPIGPRRALGLGARALMSEVEKGTASTTSPGYLQLQAAMVTNKYQDLRPQAERLAEVQEQLQAAIQAGDGTLISKLGKEINRIKAGL